MKIVFPIGMLICATSCGAIAQETLPHTYLHPNWSPDGTELVFQDRYGTMGNLRSINMATNESVELTKSLPWDSYPAYDPTGTKIVFVRAPDGPANDWDLYILDLQTSMQRQVTDVAARDWHPQWSPDGTKISFIRTIDDQTDIFVMEMSSGDITRVTNTPDQSEYHPKWRPDNNALVFDRHTENVSEIAEINLTNGSDRTLFVGNGKENLGTPSYSADGRTVYFVRQAGFDNGLWALDRNSGTAQAKLRTDADENIGGPVESPDGSRIAFHFQRNGSFDICMVNSVSQHPLRPECVAPE